MKQKGQQDLPYFTRILAFSGTVYALLALLLGLVPFFFPAWCGSGIDYRYVFGCDLVLSGLLILACVLILGMKPPLGKVLLVVFSLAKLSETVLLVLLDAGYADFEGFVLLSIVPLFLLGACLFDLNPFRQERKGRKDPNDQRDPKDGEGLGT
ncbi:MAG: hypothetical protein KA419_09525 [Acidobacteria bacterium]|nr:hypothetical protein [Acidobacteriota bacterium]